MVQWVLSMLTASLRQLSRSAAFALLLWPALSLAHVEEKALDHGAHDARKARESSAQVGLDERLGDLVTGPTIILPVYYSCTNVCTFMQGGLARVLPDIRQTPGVDYRVISVSIDENETPQLAAGSKRMYLAAMNGAFPSEGWRFLTGDSANIRRLTESAGYRFERRGRDFMHPVASFVVAGDGKIVRYLYGTSFLSKDLTLALVEAGQGKTGATIRKVVAYCFSFDPKMKSYQFNLLRVSATVVILCCGSFFAYLMLTGRKRNRQ